MTLSAITLVQQSGPVADVCLLFVIFSKHRFQAFRALTLLVFSDLLWAIAVHITGAANGRIAYIAIDLVSVVLQLMVVAELLSKVIPSDSRLAPAARRTFIRLALAGTLLAILAAFLFDAPGLTQFALYATRLDIFTGLIICEAVIAMMMAAQKVGLGWRNHALAVGQGLMLWALSYVFIEGIGPYLHYHALTENALYYGRVIIYLITAAYWSVSLWREEPARKPISPEMRKYIVALHDRVHYDLGKVGH